MNILEQIISSKKNEVSKRRKEMPLENLTSMPNFDVAVNSLSQSIRAGNGIIAEFKRRSPSAGEIQNRRIQDVIKLYKGHEVSGYSVLTDFDHFGGSVEDLELARKSGAAPVLRKEFIVDEYQVFEAKAFGADAILLIAEALDDYYATHLATIAHSIGLEVLMEFHSEEEIEKLNEFVDVIGINNRDLRTLKTDLNTSERLMRFLPYNKVKITESGISNPAELERLYNIGYEGCLVGESVLKDPLLLGDLCDAANNSKFCQV